MADEPFHTETATHAFRLKRVEDKVDQILEQQQEMNLRLALLAQRKECPDPGSCVRLAEMIGGKGGMHERVQTLEMQREYVRGAWKSVVLLAGVVATAASWLWDKLAGSN